MSDLRPTSNAKRKRVIVYFCAFALMLLIAIGAMGRNGWLPRTDAMTGEKFGWFGSKLPRNAGSTWNPLAASSPTPTPQLSKEFIYAGSRMLAVVDANATGTPPADLAVWRPGTGVWWVLGSSSTPQYAQGWGTSGDIPAQGDFDGDGKTDFSIFRPSTGTWWILKSSDATYYAVQFGISSDNLAHAGYDGDGRTDVAVWRASDGMWYIIQSSSGAVRYETYGINTDKPAPADYDGDGKADIAVWRGSTSTFYSVNSNNNSNAQFSFTQISTEPVSSDYDGDGRADYAIRSGNNWVIRKSSYSQLEVVTWQNGSDTAVHNDYDGDGKTDIAVWRKTDSPAGTLGNWYIRQSSRLGTSNELRQVQWGILNDIPVPAFWRR